MKQKSHNKAKLLVTSTPVNAVPEEALLVKQSKEIQPELPIKTDIDKPQLENDAGEEAGETLEQFNARQRLLEEQNRQRKDFLSKVLSDR